jgi:hypothetical protein
LKDTFQFIRYVWTKCHACFILIQVIIKSYVVSIIPHDVTTLK